MKQKSVMPKQPNVRLFPWKTADKGRISKPHDCV